MAGLFDKQSDIYLDFRPTYPEEWYSTLADRTTHHSLAWDVGTGNGQAATAVAVHYQKVIATDISESQLKFSIPHPKIHYLHTPLTLSDDELVSLIGGEGSIDLITVAQAVHWFDLPKFYSIAVRVLKKPGGVLAVWGYNDIVISPEIDLIMKRFSDTTTPFWDPKIKHLHEGYKNLPFPFKSVGLGSEGNPILLDLPKEISLEGFLGMLRSWSAVITAKQKGVDLLPKDLVREFEKGWGGGPKFVRSVVYKAFMLAGTVQV